MAEVTGLLEFRGGIEKGLLVHRQAINEKLNAIGEQMVAEIRIYAPKKSGALAASVRYVVVDTNDGLRLKILIGNRVVYYASFIEYGTAKAPAHPFVRPVVYRYESKMTGELEQVVAAAWGRND